MSKRSSRHNVGFVHFYPLDGLKSFVLKSAHMGRTSKSCAAMTQTQKAYIAGFLDGEGCLTISYRMPGPETGSKGCHRIIVHACNTNRTVIKTLRRLTGLGQVHKFNVKQERNRKQTWQWQVWSREATSLLLQIEDFLIVKRAQCRLLLRFAELLETQPYNYLSARDWQRQVAFRVAIRKLNKKGVQNGASIDGDLSSK